MTKWSVGGIATAVVALVLFAQPTRAQLPRFTDLDKSHEPAAAGPLPEWDVSVVRPHPPEDPEMSWRSTPDGLSMVNLQLEQLICSAWDLGSWQISGLTGWMKSGGYDLTAKVGAEDMAAYKKLNAAQRREMMQKLLAERFQLKTHMETKTLPVYDLVVDKTGSKLKTSTALAAPSQEEAKANPEKYKKGQMMMGPGRFEGTGVPVASLADQLSNALEKTVNDKTALAGLYDIDLHYRREQAAPDNGADPDMPDVFLAVQEQLGLKLVSSKAPVAILIVDSAAKPEAN